MAQSRERRNQRRKQQQRRRQRQSAPADHATPAAPRRNLRRVVIGFLVLVGLAGILAVSAPSDDPSGAAVPVYERR